MFANVERDIKVNIPSADRQVEREREERERDACVLIEFGQIFLLWEFVYVFQSLCRSLQKI